MIRTSKFDRVDHIAGQYILGAIYLSGMIQVNPNLLYRSFKTAIVFFSRQFPLGTFLGTICFLCIIQNLSRKQFQNSCIRIGWKKSKHPRYMVNPLSVSVEPSEKKRLILDLRCVNKHLIKQRVKYEDWRIGLSYFQNGAFMISFDLKSFNGS